MATSSIFKNISLNDETSIQNFIIVLESAKSAQPTRQNISLPDVQEITTPEQT